MPDERRLVDADVITVALLKERLDAWETRFDKWEARLDRVMDDHESRLRVVEKWTYAIPVSVITALVSALVVIIR